MGILIGVSFVAGACFGAIVISLLRDGAETLREGS